MSVLLRGTGRLIAVAALALAGAAAAAEDDGDPPMAPGGTADESAGKSWHAPLNAVGLTGSVRGGVWSSNRRLDDDTGIVVPSAWLKLDRKVGSVGVFAEGYVSREDLFGDRRHASRLREAYFEGRQGNWDFRVGRQIVAWGRTDRLNPTDLLTPRDFTLLAPEIDEDRFGAVAAKAAYAFTPSTSLIAVWLPDFRPNRVALPVRPGVNYTEDVPDSWRTWAVKLDRSGGAVDWSVSYFDGFDLSADLSLAAASGSSSTIALRHHRLRMIGADAATTIGSNRYAVEVAYARTEDPDGTNLFVKNPFLYGVVGVEHDFGDTLNLIVQGYARHVFAHQDPDAAPAASRALAIQQAVAASQFDRRTLGLTARIGRKWFNETLEGELAGSVLTTRTGYSLRPRVMYAVSDALKLIGGFEWYRGSDRTTFGLLERNRTLFAEARYIF